MGERDDAANGLGAGQLAEYNALRDEVLKRIEMRFRSVELAIAATGIFVAAAGADFVDPSVLLLYPLLGLGIAFSWAQNDIRIGQMADYIWERFEQKSPDRKSPGLHWEHHLRSLYKKKLPWGIYRHFTELSAAVVFVGAQAVCLSLGLLFPIIDWLAGQQQPSLTMLFLWLLLIPIDIAAMFVTFWLVWLRREAYRKRYSGSKITSDDMRPGEA